MAENIYTGFHAIEEKIRHYDFQQKKSGKKPLNLEVKIFYSKAGPRVKKILSLAKDAGIECLEKDEKFLDSKVSSLPEEAREHRGILLLAAGDAEQVRASNSVQLDQWLLKCPEKATVLILDSVTDPHNVGAVIRSMDQFGADLLILPDHRSAGDVFTSEIVARTSAGASAYVPLASVTNLVRSVQLLKDAGFWIFGADAGGQSLQNVQFPEKTCLVMGSEGSGISHLLEDSCDNLISIPTCGKIDSLNVSVAAGVLLYERYRQSLTL